MRLPSADGASVDLRPIAYQFPGMGGEDADWLVIAGDVRLADGHRWSFTDPCLTTLEARSLGDWLRGVVAGCVKPAGAGGDEPQLQFTEPNLAFSLAARSRESAVVRVHLSLESSPPWRRETYDVFDFFVALDLPLRALAAAADGWDGELSLLW